jgi:hypothetical protein
MIGHQYLEFLHKEALGLLKESLGGDKPFAREAADIVYIDGVRAVIGKFAGDGAANRCEAREPIRL